MGRRVVMLLVGLLLLVPGFEAAAAPRPGLVHVGRIQDEQGQPVSGIFPMTFSLYASRTARRAVWSERLFVAVQDGGYRVDLGQQKAVPAKAIAKGLLLGVAVGRGPEFAREPLTERNEPQGVAAAVPTGRAPAAPAAAGAGAGAPSGEFAREAATAYEAERARNADRLENLTLAQIVEKLGGGHKVRIGSEMKTMGPVGGKGGTPFEQGCPKGMVAVGIRGGSGRYIDSIELICSPIE